MKEPAKSLCRCKKAFKETINDSHGLTFGTSHAVTASIYKGGHEATPYAALTLSGEHKIPLLKLVLILAGGIFAIALICRLMKSAKHIMALLKEKMCKKCEKSPDCGVL